MARQNNVLLFGIVFLAVLGLAAAASSPSPSAPPSKAPTTAPDTSITEVEAPITNDQIGTTDDDSAAAPGDGDVAVAGPIGSDSSYANNGPSGSTDSADSGATTFGVSAVIVSVASMAGSFLFF